MIVVHFQGYRVISNGCTEHSFNTFKDPKENNDLILKDHILQVSIRSSWNICS